VGKQCSNCSSDWGYVHFPMHMTCWKTELILVVTKFWALLNVNYIMKRGNRSNCFFATRIKCQRWQMHIYEFIWFPRNNMLIMHISQICSLISVFKNKIYETLIDKTLSECVLLITDLFRNTLIFLQHLVISYLTCLNTGTLVIKKYALRQVCICMHKHIHTHTHTHSPLIIQLYITFLHTSTPFFLCCIWHSSCNLLLTEQEHSVLPVLRAHPQAQVRTVQWLICPPS